MNRPYCCCFSCFFCLPHLYQLVGNRPIRLVLPYIFWLMVILIAAWLHFRFPTMTYELEILFGASLLYLLILFFIAYVTDSGLVPESWTSNPLSTFSRLVYATSWSYYGSVGFAEREGYMFLTAYLGVTIAFLLSPLLLRPILRLTRVYQLHFLADLLAFRYRSQLAGILVTLFMLIGSLPYIALQIRAITTSLIVLTGRFHHSSWHSASAAC